MVKDSTISFQTSSEIRHYLDKLAEQKKQSVSSVVESIIYSHLKDNKALEEGIFPSRRRSERMKVDLPAYIGDPRWQRSEFIAVKISDLSLGGIRFSAPKGTRAVIESNSETTEFKVIFTLPDTFWPINVEFHPWWVSESEEEDHVGAAFVKPDYYTYTTLQKRMM